MSKRRSLLVVDDNRNWRELLAMIFADEYDISAAETYEQALLLLKEHKPAFELAIIDIRLIDTDAHNEDGLRLLRDIQELGTGTRAIILTGYPDLRTSRIALRDLDAFDYLEKYPAKGGGLDIDALRQMVHQAAGEARALLVEDEPQWQELLTSILHEEGYAVDRVSTSDDAQHHLRTGSYPVAIVDLKLGDESPEQGIALLEYAGRLESHPGVVVISGYGSKERVRDAFEIGKAQAFIFKDRFDPAQFREKIRSAHIAGWHFRSSARTGGF
jgi:DNA-binding NtrC family response regulator